MNMGFNPDWRYLRPALIVVVLAVIFSCLLLFLGADYRQHMADYYDLKSAEYSDVEMQLEEVREDKEILAVYLDKFNALEKTGVFDNKRRVEWVDAVNNARKNMKLPLVRYQISPQVEFSAEYLMGDGEVNVRTSQVKLEAGLLHEADLVDLFKWMDQYAPGQMHVSDCKMRRSEDKFGYYADRPNLKLYCELLWFTIHPIVEEGVDVGY